MKQICSVTLMSVRTYHSQLHLPFLPTEKRKEFDFEIL